MLSNRRCCFAQQGLGAAEACELIAIRRFRPMTKLSDTQMIVLSSAAKHDEGLATRPASPLLRTLAGNDRIPLI
jgi:hypothetical protein